MEHRQEIPLQRLLCEHFDPSDRDDPGGHHLGQARRRRLASGAAQDPLNLYTFVYIL
jgi:hypothetical protein